MNRLGYLAIRQPRRALGACLFVLCLFGYLGVGLEDRLHRSALQIGGTESSAASMLTAERFGAAEDLVVMLDGPRAAVERQRPAVLRALEREPVSVIAADEPRGKGLILLRVRGSFDDVTRDVVPSVRAALRGATSGPVRARLTGFADIAAGVHEGSISAIRKSEMLAAPLLLLILLLVFRSVVAAAVPLFVGIATIGAATGVLELLNRMTALDAVALNLASMMGLALGVDYSLLLVSRFRQELARTGSVEEAGRIAVQRAGHTVWLAGIALVAVMVTALMLTPAICSARRPPG